jgi:chaperonin GroEL
VRYRSGEFLVRFAARIDPAQVVRIALQDAASAAGLLVTAEAMVAELPKDKPAMPDGDGMSMGC